MIQSPQQVYTPAQQQAYAPAAQPGQPVHQMPATEYNAVNIKIVDPKVLTQGTQQSGTYSYPTNSVYDPNSQAPAPVYYPPIQQPPVQVPPPVINTQNNAPTVPPSVIPTQQPVPQTPAAPAENPTVEAVPQPTPAQSNASFNVDELTKAIKSEDLEQSGAAIEKVADIAQSNPAEAPLLLDKDLMESLIGVLAKDTEQLPGPTEKQKDLRNKLLEGQTLTPDELAEAQTVTPQDILDRNKQYALFTISIIQNLLISEFQKQNNVIPDFNNLPGMDQIVNTIKDNNNPLLRASGLAALAYNSRAEYKPIMEEIFQLSTTDADASVRKVANDGLNKLKEIK